MIEYIGIIVVAAILVEAVVTALKPIWTDKQWNISEVVPLAIGIIIALAAGLDIAAAVGVAISWPILPQVITGIIISRGANYVYDIVSKLQTK